MLVANLVILWYFSLRATTDLSDHPEGALRFAGDNTGRRDMHAEKLFGTSGIRGVVDRDLSPDFCRQVALAIGTTLPQSSTVCIATDTRISRDVIKEAVTAGLLSSGINVVDLGILPTPALALLTRESGFAAGIMITASHNPPEFNGIKLFAGDALGYSRAQEVEIERVFSEKQFRQAKRGRLEQGHGMKERYLSFIKDRFSRPGFNQQPGVGDGSGEGGGGGGGEGSEFPEGRFSRSRFDERRGVGDGSGEGGGQGSEFPEGRLSGSGCNEQRGVDDGSGEGTMCPEGRFSGSGFNEQRGVDDGSDEGRGEGTMFPEGRFSRPGFNEQRGVGDGSGEGGGQGSEFPEGRFSGPGFDEWRGVGDGSGEGGGGGGGGEGSEFYEGRLSRRGFSKQLKVVVDAGNGAASGFAGDIFVQMGLDVIRVNDEPDGLFPGRNPEPKADTLQGTVAFLRQHNADLAICFDGDADRVVFCDREGFLGFNECIAFISRLVIKRTGRKKVATTVEAGTLLDLAVKDLGGEVVRGRVGDVAVAHLVRDLDAALGVEEVGVYIIPEAGYYPDSIYASLLLLSQLEDAGEIRRFFRRMPRLYFEKARISCPNELKESVMDRVRDKAHLLRPDEVNTLDGLRLEFADSWMLIRASGTEPIIRVIGESASQQQTRELIGRGSELVESVARGNR